MLLSWQFNGCFWWKWLAISMLLFLVIPGDALAQTTPPNPAKAHLTIVSGIVKDSLLQVIPGARITFVQNDTIRTVSNDSGRFSVKLRAPADYLLTVQSIGFEKVVKKGRLNQDDKTLSLGSIILRSSSLMLEEVKVRVKHGVVLKEDTTEFYASDYVRRKNDGVGRLLSKVEGVIVDEKTGEVKFQGKAISVIRLNGKNLEGADMAKLLKTLPADIVSKIQMVDDFGEEARLTGIKKGEPAKVLNLTTREDRSVGTLFSIAGELGSNERTNGSAFVQRINGNRQVYLMSNLSHTMNRVADLPPSFALPTNNTPGYNGNGYHSLSFSDQINKKLKLTAGYGLNTLKSKNNSNSYGVVNTSLGQNKFVNQSRNETRSVSHNFSSQIEYKIDSLTTFQLRPSFSVNSNESQMASLRDNQNTYSSGFEHQFITNNNTGNSKSPRWGLSSILVKKFHKAGRILSLSYTYRRGRNTQETNSNTGIMNYADSTRNNLVRDSLTHLITSLNNRDAGHSARIQYTEPLTKKSRLEFTAQYNRNAYANSAITDTVFADGQRGELTRLSNIYNYSFTEGRVGVSYRYKSEKWELNTGGLLVPTLLKGNRVDRRGQGQDAPASINNFRVIPEFNLSYIKNRNNRLSVSYNGSTTPPSFSQIQPFVNLTDPTNIVIGNPHLQPSFTHNVGLNYNRANFEKGYGMYVTSTVSINRNQVLTNVKQRVEPFTVGGASIIRTINETYYLNMNGSHAAYARFGFNKQWKTLVSLNVDGSVGRNRQVGMSNDEVYKTDSWSFDQRINARITPGEHYEISPVISYSQTTSNSSLANSSRSRMGTWVFGVDGSVYYFQRLRGNYYVNKTIITGLNQLGNPSPWVINLSLSADLFAKKILSLTVSVNDLLHQNNLIRQDINPSGYTNTLTNNTGRYFSVGATLNLQKWGGRVSRKGKILPRRGDGSFIQ